MVAYVKKVGVGFFFFLPVLDDLCVNKSGL